MVSERKSQKPKREGEEGAGEGSLGAVHHGTGSSRSRSVASRAEELHYHTREATREGAGEAAWASNKSNPREETAGFQNPPPPPSSATVRRAGGVGDASSENRGGELTGGLGIGTARLGGNDPDLN